MCVHSAIDGFTEITGSSQSLWRPLEYRFSCSQPSGGCSGRNKQRLHYVYVKNTNILCTMHVYKKQKPITVVGISFSRFLCQKSLFTATIFVFFFLFYEHALNDNTHICHLLFIFSDQSNKSAKNFVEPIKYIPAFFVSVNK